MADVAGLNPAVVNTPCRFESGAAYQERLTWGKPERASMLVRLADATRPLFYALLAEQADAQDLNPCA
jgi:hypothetical protein